MQLLLLLQEVVVRLRLLERRLPVLPDEHERRQEYRCEGHHERQLRPRVALDGQHPAREQRRVEIEEVHRAGERRDRVGDAKLVPAEPKALRYRLLHVPARLVRNGRRRRLRIPQSWPWGDALATLLTRIATIHAPG